MTPGRVIVLNGTTSSGKTTLAKNLQDRLAADGECWVVIGLDDYFAKLPFDWITYSRHIGKHADQGIEFVMVDGHAERHVGPIAVQVLDAYRKGVASAARAGLNVIVDEVLLSEEDWRAWLVELEGIDVRWVRIDCAVEVAEARERERGDRMIGLARAQFDVVHRHPTYDLTVDTGTLGADDAAAAVRAAVRSPASAVDDLLDGATRAVD